jgi:ABC-2 type transport system permease protein
MFTQIFLFEMRYRLRRPAFYIYFILVLGFSALAMAQGDIGAQEKEMFNSPHMLAGFAATMTIFLMLVSSAIMGTPLYRDLEHNTKEYYLAYPITKAGYFWGRFLGSFVFVLAIGAAVIVGNWLGTILGPAFGWQTKSHYGPNLLSYYLRPFFILILPTLFFTSALFFGLVAIFRNVKVIYSSGIFFFLGYILANFVMHNVHNNTVTYLSDPFLQNAMRMSGAGRSASDLNHTLLQLTGLVFWNRLLWGGLGLLVIGATWWRFSFERFFSGRQSKGANAGTTPPPVWRAGFRPNIELKGAYYRRTLFSLTRIELLNIIRDNYFWIILSGGYLFLTLVFSMGPGYYDVRSYPRTVFFVDAFADVFIFFIFLIIIFYTGETVHREKLTRYAFINDSLPPPDWVLNTAKLLSLCILAVFLALTPMLIGLPVQLFKGWFHPNFGIYFSSIFVVILPKLLLMVLFCYAVHLVVNNKFAAHGIAITVWIVLFCLVAFNYFNYNLLLYSYVPQVWASDMDGIGHMVRPILWFQSYWTLAGIVLVLIGGLFFARGVNRSGRERLRLARQRFTGPTRVALVGLLVAFLAVGSFIYYNVSYLNAFKTPYESNEEKALVEKALKRYDSSPLPSVARLTLHVDLYPSQQREETNATVLLTNKGNKSIDTLLVDGDGLDFELQQNGTPMKYTIPLYLPRGKFNFLRPSREPSDYRLYVLPAPLQPGDTVPFQVRSVVAFHGFQNSLYGTNALYNGMFTAGNLPGTGYDAGDELRKGDVRKTHGLPPRVEKEIPADDPVGRFSLASGENTGVIPYDLTVSTDGDQGIAASGHLEKEWQEGGRHFYHFVQESPGIYPPAGILTERFATWHDSVRLDNGRQVQLEIAYYPEHGINLAHFAAAMKDGLAYYSKEFGPYPYDRLSVVESPAYGRRQVSTPGVIYIAEHNCWTSDLRPRGTFDLVYYSVAMELAHQWWGFGVAPNGTLASRIIDVGVPRYAALALLAQQKDSSNVKRALEFLGWDYGWGHRTNFDGERPLLTANKWYQWDAEATTRLWDLAKRIGTDSVNARLQSFYKEWALRTTGPYPGADDLASAIPELFQQPIAKTK